MNWDNQIKNSARYTTLSYLTEPVRNGIVFPAADCLDIRLLMSLGKVDENSHFICIERDKKTRDKAIELLDSLGVSYEYPSTQCLSFTDYSLHELMRGRKSNFAYFDTCSIFTRRVHDWSIENLKDYGRFVFDSDSLLAFNFTLSSKRAPVYYPAARVVKATQTYAIENDRIKTPIDYHEADAAFTTMYNACVPRVPEKSAKIVYKAYGAKEVMVSSIFNI